MPTIKNEPYYQIKEDYAKKLITKYHTYEALAKLSKIPLYVIDNMYNQGSKLSLLYANRVCSIESIELIDGFDLFEAVKIDRDLTHIQLSEQMINGFKLNIQKRLSITHSRPYVDEIIGLIENIIDESCYLGIECCEKNKKEYITNRVIKRRKNE